MNRRSAVLVAGTLALVLARPAASDTTEGAVRPVNPFSGNGAVATEGASLFNQYCSHCHGQWAEQGERVRDLRRLRIRYGDDAISVFYATVSNGRLSKGMPVWSSPEEEMR